MTNKIVPYLCFLYIIFPVFLNGQSDSNFVFNHKKIPPEAILYFYTDFYTEGNHPGSSPYQLGSYVNLCKKSFVIPYYLDTMAEKYQKINNKNWYISAYDTTGWGYIEYSVVGKIPSNIFVLMVHFCSGGSEIISDILILHLNGCKLELQGVINQPLIGRYPVTIKGKEIIYNGNLHYKVKGQM